MLAGPHDGHLVIRVERTAVHRVPPRLVVVVLVSAQEASSWWTVIGATDVAAVVTVAGVTRSRSHRLARRPSRFGNVHRGIGPRFVHASFCAVMLLALRSGHRDDRELKAGE